MEQNEKQLKLSDIPKKYVVCYNHQCPRADECLRHLCYNLLPATVYERPCVLPQAWQSGECQRFAVARPVQLAWGMSRLFDDVSRWQKTAIRHELKALFGSKATYFRYRRGEFLITPQRQREVAAVFQRYGYTAPRHYDHVLQDYFFDVPGFGSHHATTKWSNNRKLLELQSIPSASLIT